MDATTFEEFILNAATIDERLSDSFETISGRKSEASLAAKRLAAWCNSSANGDWKLFGKRLARDNLTFEATLARLSTIRRKPNTAIPLWASDAQWILRAFSDPIDPSVIEKLHRVGGPVAFEDLIAPVVAEAEKKLQSALPDHAFDPFTDDSISCLCHALAVELSELCSPFFFELFEDYQFPSMQLPDETNVTSIDGGEAATNRSERYNRFVAEIQQSHSKPLFLKKPMLLRLLAELTRQWIESTSELISRFNTDLPSIKQILGKNDPGAVGSRIMKIQGDLSDRHNNGRSVKLLHTQDGTSVLYKPKDIEIDEVWANTIQKLNSLGPIQLKAVRVLAKAGYGWAEFIEHEECEALSDFQEFFRRAGAWLCLFHLLVGTDMHEQNMIASRGHPVPVDLEMLLQSLPFANTDTLPETQAVSLAGQKIIESVTMTGLLPSFWRTPENKLVGSGGLNNIKAVYTHVAWQNINSDLMEPYLADKNSGLPTNLPVFKGEQPLLVDYVDFLILGFRDYAKYLLDDRAKLESIFSDFKGLQIRRVMKNTRFYYLLIERLKDHHNMDDGAEWSAQMDFVARFSDWDRQEDVLWKVAQAERVSLARLDIPHFVSTTDSAEIRNSSGPVAVSQTEAGLDRARSRFTAFDSNEIDWQVDVIKLSTRGLRLSASPQAAERRVPGSDGPRQLLGEDSTFRQVAADISRHLADLSIQKGTGASWIGLDWLGHSGLSRVTALGDDLYSGATGICRFLAAQAAVGSDDRSRALSLAGMTSLQQKLRSANSSRFLRGLGVGGLTGLGSAIYAMATIHSLIDDVSLLDDAVLASTFVGPDLLAADNALDLFDGSAGCILGLIKLFEVTRDRDVLARAVACGDYLLDQPRVGINGSRSWLGLSVAERSAFPLSRPLNGMSHGAAGFAYSLSVLGSISGRADFSGAAEECIAFENETYSADRSNWPDFRLKGNQTEPAWLSQWCHGAAGIGLSRLGMLKRSDFDRDLLVRDAGRAVTCVSGAWPYPGDNLCCGNLGNIELLTEAGRTLGLSDLASTARARLLSVIEAANYDGEYQFDGVDRRFDLGVFRGVAGIGYSCLRQVSEMVPCVVILE